MAHGHVDGCGALFDPNDDRPLRPPHGSRDRAADALCQAGQFGQREPNRIDLLQTDEANLSGQ